VAKLFNSSSMQKSKADRIAELRLKRMANKGTAGQDSQATKYLRKKPVESVTHTNDQTTSHKPKIDLNKSDNDRNLHKNGDSLGLNTTDSDMDSTEFDTTDIDKLIFFKNLELNNESLDYAKLNMELSDDDLVDTSEILTFDMNGNIREAKKNLIYPPRFEMDQTLLDNTGMDKHTLDCLVKTNPVEEPISNKDLPNNMEKIQDISKNSDTDFIVSNTSVSFENASSINNQHLDYESLNILISRH
jgi:hypothetical protein